MQTKRMKLIFLLFSPFVLLVLVGLIVHSSERPKKLESEELIDLVEEGDEGEVEDYPMVQDFTSPFITIGSKDAVYVPGLFIRRVERRNATLFFEIALEGIRNYNGFDLFFDFYDDSNSLVGSETQQVSWVVSGYSRSISVPLPETATGFFLRCRNVQTTEQSIKETEEIELLGVNTIRYTGDLPVVLLVGRDDFIAQSFELTKEDTVITIRNPNVFLVVD